MCLCARVILNVCVMASKYTLHPYEICFLSLKPGFSLSLSLTSYKYIYTLSKSIGTAKPVPFFLFFHEDVWVLGQKMKMRQEFTISTLISWYYYTYNLRKYVRYPDLVSRQPEQVTYFQRLRRYCHPWRNQLLVPPDRILFLYTCQSLTISFYNSN